MINIKKDWRWMDSNKETAYKEDEWCEYGGLPSPKAYDQSNIVEEHPYYDSQSKKDSFMIASIAMMGVILMVVGLVIYNLIWIQ